MSDEVKALDVDLPPLPERLNCNPGNYCVANHFSGLFTADQMQAYALQAVLRERERCAKLADDMDYGMGELAAAIRGEKK